MIKVQTIWDMDIQVFWRAEVRSARGLKKLDLSEVGASLQMPPPPMTIMGHVPDAISNICREICWAKFAMVYTVESETNGAWMPNLTRNLEVLAYQQNWQGGWSSAGTYLSVNPYISFRCCLRTSRSTQPCEAIYRSWSCCRFVARATTKNINILTDKWLQRTGRRTFFRVITVSRWSNHPHLTHQPMN